jgi:hypothetical protein
MRELFSNKGWQIDRHLRLDAASMKRYEVDFVREKVGVELCLGKQAFAIYSLFVNFPVFIKAGGLDIAILLFPMRDLSRQMPAGVGNFESVRALLSELHPMPLKYPFALLGFSFDKRQPQITQLTTPLDNYLIHTLGMSLDEMLLLRERSDYDFKESLPDNKKLAQEICGFANLHGGGIILLGIDDDGNAIGVNKVELDGLQLKVTNIIRDCCSPVPRFEFQCYDIPSSPVKAILIIHVQELESKPCMTQDKVYIRSGPSVRTATSDEIRRLILN